MKKLLSAILILAMVLSLMPALSLRSQAAETSYAEFWVDPDTGNDTNEGTQAAPFKTITKAKEIVSTIAPGMTGDIIVHLGGGTYTLSDTINFTAADSGCNGFKVIYKAVEGETPLLSGGTLISNWEVHDADKNIFVADVPEGLEDGRHFFVDGEYATHAMTEDAPIDWKIMSSYGYVSPAVDSADNEEYVIMDLGEEKLVGQLVLYPYAEVNADGKAAGFPEDFTIETSVDGINYTVQKTVTGYAAPSLGAGQEFKFTAVNARYVKLNVTKLGKAPVATADQYCLGLAEFQVFAAKKLDMSNAAANVDFSTNLLGIVKEQYSENLLLGASGDRLECMGQFNASNDFEGAPFVADGFDDTRANLFDGDVNTLVATKMYYSAWVNANQTLGLRINLTSDNGKPMKIAAVSLSAPNGGSPNTFKIQLATAAEPTADDWVTVVDTGNVKFADQSTHMFTFPETEAYKLRILCTNLNWQQWVGAPYFYYGNLQIADIAVHELVKEPAYNDDWNLLYGASGDILECFGLFNESDGYAGTDAIADEYLNSHANLFDGKVETLMASPTYHHTDMGSDQFGFRINLTSDDGKPTRISAVSLSAPNGGSPQSFVIQVATAADPTEADWVTVAEDSNTKWAEVSTRVYEFAAVKAYKLRVLCGGINWPYYNPPVFSGPFQVSDIGVYDLTEPEPGYTDDWNMLYGANADRVEHFGIFTKDSDNYVPDRAYYDDADAIVNLFDGNVSSVMESKYYYTAWMGNPLGALIDVTTNGAPTKISAISLSAPNGGSPNTFVIQLATAAEPTAGDWVTVVEESSMKWADVNTRVFEFSEITAYKLRIICTSLNWEAYNATYGWGSPLRISEIGIYDLPDPNSDPDYNDDYNMLYDASADYVEHYGIFTTDGDNYVPDRNYYDDASALVNMFDGDVNSVMESKTYYSAWIGNPLGVQLNLAAGGDPMKLSAITLSAPNGGSPNTFKIQLATAADPTASDWVTVAEESNMKWTDVNTRVFEFPEITAYKLRIVCTNINWEYNAGQFGWGSNLRIAEIGAYNFRADIEKPENIEIFGMIGNTSGDFIDGTNSVYDLIDDNMETVVSTPAYQSELLVPGENSFGVLMNVAQDGAPTSIGAVKIGANVGGINSPRDFRIQVATAAEPTEADWQTVVTMEDYDWVNGDTATFIFDAVDAYKVRLLVDDLNWETDDGDGTYSGPFQLAELAVYAATESATLAEENLVDGLINYGYYFGGGLVEKEYIHTFWPIKNLYDGNKNSIVSTNSIGYDSLTVSGGQSAPGLRVDLDGDEPVAVDAIEITVREPGICNPQSFEVQVTTEHNPKSNNDWVTVIREENFVWSEATVLFPIQSVEAVQVRLIATEVCPDARGGYFLQLGEFVVMGHTAPAGDIVDFRTPVDSVYGELITGGKITVKNNNPDPERCADTMIDGFAIDVAQNVGYHIPESYGMKDWMSTEDIEVHYSHVWYQGHFTMTPVLNDGTVIFIDNHLVQDVVMPAWLEGAYEFINVPGEWYIHRAENKIYYKSNGTMEGKTAVLGNLETLVNFDHCSNVTFDGVEFANTTWTFPTEHGYYDTQSGYYYIGLETHLQDNTSERLNPPAAIEMYYASNITITNAEIHNIGSHAVDIGEGSCNNEISNSLIYDVAGRAVGVGWLHAQDAECTFPESHKVQNNKVSNNYITRIGLDYMDNSAIIVSLANGTIVEHNEVAYVPYTGIDMGYGWDWWKVACQGENIVRYNYVHHAGQMVNDGGAIYTLGNEVGSEIYGNYVHDYGDLSNDKNVALYLDNGSHHISLYENVVGKDCGVWWGSMYASTINNCVWRDNYYIDGRFRDYGYDNTVENNTFMETGSISDYPEAQAIVDNAGLEDESMMARIPEGVASKHNYKMRVYPTHQEVYYLSVETLISATIPGQLGSTSYNWNEKTATINMPKAADITALIPELVLKDGCTCDLAAGTVVDFTTPLTVVITGERTEEWTITVKILELADTPIEGPLEGVEVTLDDAIANPGDWTIAPTQNADGSITFSQGIYFSAYIDGEDQGVFEKNTIFKFDILLPDLNSQQREWIGFSISADNTSTYNGNQYNIYFNNVTEPFDNNIELQRWFVDEEGSHREMLIGSITNYPGKFGDMPNLYLTPGVRHSIVTGAVETEGGMRLFLFVDGNLVFNVVDDTNPHAEGGYFHIHPVTGDVTLYPYSDIYKVYADFSELDKAIADAETVDPELYTEESYAAMVEVLEAAKELRQDVYARQTLVDETAQALRDAIAALKTPVDYTALEEAIAKAEAVNAEDYTPGSYAALEDALEAAKAVLENADATQEEVNAAVEALNAALEALLTPADTSALEEAIADAEAVDAEKYTEESYAALTEALEAAKAVLENTEATQEEVDAALETLNTALEALEEVDTGNGKTGDDSLLMAFALLMILSAAAICAIITLNKRMNIR